MWGERTRLRISTPSLFLTVISAAAIILIAVSAVALWRSYYETKMRIESEALSSAHVVSAHVQWIVGASRQALKQADGLIGDDITVISNEARAAIRDAVSGLPGNVTAWVFDSHGDLVFSSNDKEVSGSVADRSYFVELKDGRDFYISQMLVGRVSGQQMFAIARRVERNGQFAGVIGVAVPATLMSDFWQNLGLGAGSTISMIRNDGWLVARYPQPPGPVDLSNYVLFTKYLRDKPSGAYGAISPTDGVSRIVGYTRVENEPLVALASLSTDAHFAAFWAEAIRVSAALAVLLAILAAVVVWLLRLLRREDRNRAELSEALDQNKLLFQEIHHRVKNNLQAVSSLIKLQPMAADAKVEMVQRIGAMVAIHEQAYRSNEYAEMAVSDYLTKLIENVSNSYGKNVAFETNLAPVSIRRDLALPLGLVANEVMSNSLKHAFPDGQKGTISVTLRPVADNKAELIIVDNGVGYDPTKDSDGIGSRLIRGFITQLGGDSETLISNGTQFSIRFPALAA